MDGNFECQLCGRHGCNDRDLPGAFQVSCRKRVATLSRICDKCSEGLADVVETDPERFLEIVYSMRKRTNRTGDRPVEVIGEMIPVRPSVAERVKEFSPPIAGPIHMRHDRGSRM